MPPHFYSPTQIFSPGAIPAVNGVYSKGNREYIQGCRSFKHFGGDKPTCVVGIISTIGIVLIYHYNWWGLLIPHVPIPSDDSEICAKYTGSIKDMICLLL